MNKNYAPYVTGRSSVVELLEAAKVAVASPSVAGLERWAQDALADPTRSPKATLAALTALYTDELESARVEALEDVVLQYMPEWVQKSLTVPMAKGVSAHDRHQCAAALRRLDSLDSYNAQASQRTASGKRSRGSDRVRELNQGILQRRENKSYPTLEGYSRRGRQGQGRRAS